MLNVLILGANSFIGSHLTKFLSADPNIHLTAFARTLTVAPISNVNYITGDYIDEIALSKALNNKDIVFHFISQSYPFSSWNDPVSEIKKNIVPFINFIELCNTANVKKIVFASSGGTIYGVKDSKSNELSDTKPYTPYGMSKLYMENLLIYARTKYHIAYDIYRMSNVYGEDQVTQKGLGFIHAALENAIKGKPITIYGNGSNTRDYIYIDDVCNFLSLSIQKPLTVSETYNVCCNNSVSLNDILNIIRNDLKIDFAVEFQPARKSDVLSICLDNTKILNQFPGYRFVTIQEGIEKIYISMTEKI
jgi:UDP-glucose 4-epimerase